MKIGIVCYPTFGGSGVIATELGKALAKSGHQVHFITYSQPVRLDSFTENVFYHEVSIPNYPLFEYAPYESALTSRLVDTVKYEQLDILHVHYAIPHASVAFMAKQILAQQGIHIPVVTTLHGTDITLVGKSPSYEPIVTFAINQSDGITSVSESLKRDTLQNFKITKDIEVIPNFIDLDRFAKQRKDHFRKMLATQGERLVVHTSNFRKVKRVQDVVKAFAHIQAKVPSKLLLVGDGPERENIEGLCRELDLCEHIRFLGKQDAMEEILSICDLFFLPSESESFGLAALEAMACQVPVISSDAGGIPELNIDGKTGFVCAVGDTKTMADRAIELLLDESKLNQFKKNALEQAKRFDLKAVLPHYYNYYQQVIENFKKVETLKTSVV